MLEILDQIFCMCPNKLVTLLLEQNLLLDKAQVKDLTLADLKTILFKSLETLKEAPVKVEEEDGDRTRVIT